MPSLIPEMWTLLRDPTGSIALHIANVFTDGSFRMVALQGILYRISTT